MIFFDFLDQSLGNLQLRNVVVFVHVKAGHLVMCHLFCYLGKLNDKSFELPQKLIFFLVMGQTQRLMGVFNICFIFAEMLEGYFEEIAELGVLFV